MAKRANREGHVRQRQNGLWEARVQLERRRVSLYGKTQAEVLGKLAEAKKAQAEGRSPLPDRSTVGAFLDQWLETVKSSARPKTYESYETTVRLHLKPAIGNLPIVKLTAVDVQAMLTKLSKTRRAVGKKENRASQPVISARTVEYCLLVLRRALNKAVAWNLVSRNVATVVNPPRVVRETVGSLDQSQAVAFLEHIRGHRLEALYSVALAIGLRRGEALGLRWSDVNLETGTITVRNQLQRVSGKLALVEPKTRQARRAIDLPSFAVKALESHRKRQHVERLAAEETWQETGYVFTTRVGTPIEPRNITRHFGAAIRRAKLPALRFHDLRHTCASLMLAQGVHPRAVMEILGHSRIGLTMDTYSHVLPSVKKETA